ncbi:MAG: NAD-binding protein [Chroococcidiopsidaceae cyanobacterium CP_BM_RX_35]|nr:NAD-binding protein [Chroococcidiopsidaceae cyanobacterium CP_BM_RX_35]
MKQITLGDRLRYKFDNLMSGGTIALVAVLSLLTLLLITSITAFLYLFGLGTSYDGTPLRFGQILWVVFNHAIDPGSLNSSQGNLYYLGGMLLTTLVGIFIVSALIGIVATGFNTKLEELRRGRSFVIESEHTLILGWSSTIFTIISQLVLANANQSRSAVVILADQDKVAMEDEIKLRVGSTGRTRIICRTGNPSDLDDLEIANPHTARSIIILPPESPEADVWVIKTILAIVQNPQRHPQPYNIVTQLYDVKNREVAQMIGRDEVLTFRFGAILGYMIVESVRQVHISWVITELVSFEGGEIYFQKEPLLVGKNFGEALLMYEDSTVIGLRLSDGEILINPPMDKAIAPGTQIIAISENDETLRLSGIQDYEIDAEMIRVPQPHPPQPKRLLMLGWNTDVPEIINRLEQYMAIGSSILLIGANPDTEAEIARRCKELKHLTVKFRVGDIQDRSLLEELNIPSYDHVVVLSPFERLSAQAADAQTLIVLLHLRDISERSGYKFPIVTELMEESSRNLARVARVDDVIVSNQFVSLVLAQISENKDRLPTLLGLTNPEGNHLQLRPTEDYVELGCPVNFYTVVESAKRYGHLVLGYCVEKEAEDTSKIFRVQLNPDKSERITFVQSDRLIVVAKD